MASILLLAAALMAGAACQRGPAMYTVSGQVSYEGQPLQTGQILFEPADGVGATALAMIENGRYELQTTAGRKTVRITATRETGAMLEGAMGAVYPEVEDILPPRFNTESTLSVTVEEIEPATFDFHLP